MAGTKLNAATPVYENMVDIFSHSSGYFRGKLEGVVLKKASTADTQGKKFSPLRSERFAIQIVLQKLPLLIENVPGKRQTEDHQVSRPI